MVFDDIILAYSHLSAGLQHYHNEETCRKHVYKIIEYQLMYEQI